MKITDIWDATCISLQIHTYFLQTDDWVLHSLSHLLCSWMYVRRPGKKGTPLRVKWCGVAERVVANFPYPVNVCMPIERPHASVWRYHNLISFTQCTCVLINFYLITLRHTRVCVWRLWPLSRGLTHNFWGWIFEREVKGGGDISL